MACALALLAVPGTARARALPGAVGAGTRAGAWGAALEVPGTGVLNTGGTAGIDSVSCASPGNCSAGGSYASPGPERFHAFVVSQVRGRWQRALKVPGMAVLNRGIYAAVVSVSCASPGNCSAGGYYDDGSHNGQAFVVSQVHGRWGRARPVRGTAALNTGGFAQVSSVSCASPGNCAAAGSYTTYANSVRRPQAFMISQVHGRWGRARPVPGLAALATGGSSSIAQVSCPSPGNCAAGGDYQDGPVHYGAFVVSEVNGRWRRALPVPGMAALQTGIFADVSTVSCAAAGNCAAGGRYDGPGGARYGFLVSQVHGRWGKAVRVPGMAALVPDGAGLVSTVSCPSAGNCAAGGTAGDENDYDVGGGGQAFVVSETNGTWGRARLIPGTAALNSGDDAATVSLSCATAGNCSVVGYYGIGTPGNKVYNLEVFAAGEVRGTWGRAREIPGTAALNKGHWAGIGALSCAAPARCSAGGSYEDGAARFQAFVVSQS
jgi:hypothetical protein